MLKRRAARAGRGADGVRGGREHRVGGCARDRGALGDHRQAAVVTEGMMSQEKYERCVNLVCAWGVGYLCALVSCAWLVLGR